MTRRIVHDEFMCAEVPRSVSVDVRYEKRGRGDIEVVAIHGLGCSKESFDGLFTAPEAANAKILTLDLIGFGDSEKPEWFSYALTDQAKVVRAVIDLYDLTKIHVVCHSMGWAVGGILAQKIPEHIASFNSLEGLFLGDDDQYSRKADKFSLDDFKRFGFDEIKQSIRTLMDRFGPNPSLEYWLKYTEKTSPEAYHRSAKSFIHWCDDPASLEWIRALPKKAAYFYGESNNLKQFKDTIEKLRGFVDLIPISNANHFMMLDNPKEFYKRLFERIESVK